MTCAHVVLIAIVSGNYVHCIISRVVFSEGDFRKLFFISIAARNIFMCVKS